MIIRLTESESLQLTDLEGIIERGIQTFVEVGAAIRLIRDKRLYRTTHSTFEEYCRDRWGLQRDEAYRKIAHADVVHTMSEISDTVPQNEGQARALAKVPEERRAEVWDEVVENAPVVKGKPKITARQVAEAASAATEKTDTKWAGPRIYRGRSPLEGVRNVIGRIAGLVSNFDTVTAADCAPNEAEAEEWEGDLKNAVNLINRFRRTLKEHRAGGALAGKDVA